MPLKFDFSFICIWPKQKFSFLNMAKILLIKVSPILTTLKRQLGTHLTHLGPEYRPRGTVLGDPVDLLVPGVLRSRIWTLHQQNKKKAPKYIAFLELNIESKNTRFGLRGTSMHLEVGPQVPNSHITSVLHNPCDQIGLISNRAAENNTKVTKWPKCLGSSWSPWWPNSNISPMELAGHWSLLTRSIVS